jgi:type I restriction enzyme, S subunit
VSEFTLPEGWVHTQLGNAIDYGKCEKADPSSIDNDTWVLELEDVEKDSSKVIQFLTFSERQSKSTKNKFKKGDVLYGKLRPYLNKVVVASNDGVCTTEIIPLNGGELVNNKFIFYWLKTGEFLSYVSAVGYGVNMPRLGTDDGKAAPFVLAPLAEQQQIAQKLDELLAQVDTLKTRLDANPNILKRFRQSVLAAAVSGRLTEDAEARKFKSLGEAGISVKTGPFGSALHKEEYVSGGIPLVNPMHINGGKITPSDHMSVTEEKFSELLAWELKPGDVILGRRGEMGRAAVVKPNSPKMLCGTGSMVLRGDDSVLPEYLCMILRSSVAIDYFNKDAVGSTMVNLNQKVIKALEVFFPPLEEQTEIVRRVEQLFAYADQIEQRVKDAQARVNHLTQSILAKAFRGELTADWRAQNPELISGENSAAALLERIRVEREIVGNKRKLKK